jgi:nucleoside-diphosphate-sugar epimerase
LANNVQRKTFEKADVVVHLAAAASTDAPYSETRNDNVVAMSNVINTAWAQRVPHFVFASSTWAEPARYRPDQTSRDPVNTYGWSKLWGEQQLVEYSGLLRNERGETAHHMSATIVRIGAAPPEGTSRPGGWVGEMFNTTDELNATFTAALTPQSDCHLVELAGKRRNIPYAEL